MYSDELRQELTGRLASLSDESYRSFNQKIVHTCAYKMYGVRIPQLKAIAREYSDRWREIAALPFDSFEEIVIKGAVIGMAKAPLKEKIPYITQYADVADNWAVCDCFCSCLKTGKNETDELFSLAQRLCKSEREFVSRIGIVLLFSKFKDEAFVSRSLEIYDSLPCGEYYRDMAVAWGLSVFCVYYPQLILDFLKSSSLSLWIKNAAAQKIRDSRRISDKDKATVTKLVKSLSLN